MEIKYIMPIAKFRFYAELNEFLPQSKRKTTFEYNFDEDASIKHIIEAIGIPHTEVDLIIVNGQSVDFSYQPRQEDQISIYPVFETFDISALNHLRPAPLRVTRFVLDTHLGKLAAYLRMLGFDTLYHNNYEDEELANISSKEDRILLTQDRGLLKRSIVTHGYFVHATDPRLQIVEVLKRFQLVNQIEPHKHCMRCNGILQPVAKEDITERLQPQTRQYYDEFYQCQQCGRVYWKGSHYIRMQDFIQYIVDELS